MNGGSKERRPLDLDLKTGKREEFRVLKKIGQRKGAVKSRVTGTCDLLTPDLPLYSQ